MDLVDVDMVGLQPPQGGFELFQNSRTAGVAENASAFPLQSHFGGDAHARAQSGLWTTRVNTRDLRGPSLPHFFDELLLRTELTVALVRELELAFSH